MLSAFVNYPVESMNVYVTKDLCRARVESALAKRSLTVIDRSRSTIRMTEYCLASQHTCDMSAAGGSVINRVYLMYSTIANNAYLRFDMPFKNLFIKSNQERTPFTYEQLYTILTGNIILRNNVYYDPTDPFSETYRKVGFSFYLINGDKVVNDKLQAREIESHQNKRTIVPLAECASQLMADNSDDVDPNMLTSLHLESRAAAATIPCVNVLRDYSWNVVNDYASHYHKIQEIARPGHVCRVFAHVRRVIGVYDALARCSKDINISIYAFDQREKETAYYRVVFNELYFQNSRSSKRKIMDYLRYLFGKIFVDEYIDDTIYTPTMYIDVLTPQMRLLHGMEQRNLKDYPSSLIAVAKTRSPNQRLLETITKFLDVSPDTGRFGHVPKAYDELD